MHHADIAMPRVQADERQDAYKESVAKLLGCAQRVAADAGASAGTVLTVQRTTPESAQQGISSSNVDHEDEIAHAAKRRRNDAGVPIPTS